MLSRSLIIAGLLTVFAAPQAFAQDKEATCALQGNVVGAIQQARLDRVGKNDVVPTLMAANPDWPEALTTAMPGLVDWVYSIRRRDLRDVALGDVAQTQCLENWEQLQTLSGTASN